MRLRVTLNADLDFSVNFIEIFQRVSVLYRRKFSHANRDAINKNTIDMKQNLTFEDLEGALGSG